MEIDLELNALFDLQMPDTTEVPADAFTKFIEDGQLAGALGRGGHQIVAALHEETQEFHRRADEIMRHSSTPPPAVDDDENVLAKMESAGIVGGDIFPFGCAANSRSEKRQAN